jgi:hypothetical protein
MSADIGDHATTHPGAERGTASWVRDRLDAISDREDWAQHPACGELIDWLYSIIQRRAARMDLPRHVRGDLVQDAMTPIVQALCRSRATIAGADNPAALLQQVAARALAGAGHAHRMAGYSGVAANGQNWRAEYPRRVAGETLTPFLEEAMAPVRPGLPAVERVASRIAEWVFERVGVELSPDAVDATVYVIDRLLSGVGRNALVRGGHSGLGTDPAMRHLGFDAAAANAFGCWLLGRADAEHNAASVLDAALFGESPSPVTDARWRRQAVMFGFAADFRPRAPASLAECDTDPPAPFASPDPDHDSARSGTPASHEHSEDPAAFRVSPSRRLQ